MIEKPFNFENLKTPPIIKEKLLEDPNLEKSNSNRNNAPNEEKSKAKLKILFKQLKEKFMKRKSLVISGFEIFLTFCCCNQKQTTLRSEVIQSLMDYINECSEIGNIIRLFRQVEFNKNLILKKFQEKMYILPSYNLKHSLETENKNEEKQEENNDQEEEEEDKDKNDDFNKKINLEMFESFENLNYNDKRNRKLVKNIIKSII